MRIRVHIVGFVCGLLLTGCAIHPLPDDVTGVSTYNIVRQIRCETREAAIQTLLGYLTDEGNNKNKTKVNDQSRAIGLRFQNSYLDDPDSIVTFRPTMLTGFARQVVSTMWHTGIAYNFDLQMLETNNFDPEVNLLRALPTSGANLGLKGTFDRQRQNTRVFTITDNLGDLVTKVHSNYCTKFIKEANIVYPIAGKVGMERVVQDFLLLSLFGNLSGDATKDVTKAEGPPTMVDQLEFTTTLGGTVTPKATFSPAGSAIHVADASFGLNVSRTDTHKLTVGLYLDQTGSKEIGAVRHGIFQDLVTATGGRAQRGAAAAVDQFLRQRIFQPKIVVQR